MDSTQLDEIKYTWMSELYDIIATLGTNQPNLSDLASRLGELENEIGYKVEVEYEEFIR